MPPSLVPKIKQAILDLLQSDPMTLNDLTRKSGYNYYTLRKALNELRDQGLVDQLDKGARNVRYTLGAGKQTNQIIPSLVWKGDVTKSTNFKDPKAIEQIAAKNAMQIAFGLLRIFKQAERIYEGAPTVQTSQSLKRIRAQIASAVAELEHLAHFGNQILNSDKFWDPEMLERFPYDETWEEFHPRLNELLQNYLEGNN